MDLLAIARIDTQRLFFKGMQCKKQGEFKCYCRFLTAIGCNDVWLISLDKEQKFQSFSPLYAASNEITLAPAKRSNSAQTQSELPSDMFVRDFGLTTSQTPHLMSTVSMLSPLSGK